MLERCNRNSRHHQASAIHKGIRVRHAGSDQVSKDYSRSAIDKSHDSPLQDVRVIGIGEPRYFADENADKQGVRIGSEASGLAGAVDFEFAAVAIAGDRDIALIDIEQGCSGQTSAEERACSQLEASQTQHAEIRIDVEVFAQHMFENHGCRSRKAARSGTGRNARIQLRAGNGGAVLVHPQIAARRIRREASLSVGERAEKQQSSE